MWDLQKAMRVHYSAVECGRVSDKTEGLIGDRSAMLQSIVISTSTCEAMPISFSGTFAAGV